MARLQGLLVALAVAAGVAGQSPAVRTCLEKAVADGGSVAFPDTLLYQQLFVNRYNLNIPVTPAAVTFPTSSDQVSAVVKCAANNGYPVQPRSGGHSYGNYGMSSVPSLSPRQDARVTNLFIGLLRTWWNGRSNCG